MPPVSPSFQHLHIAAIGRSSGLALAPVFHLAALSLMLWSESTVAGKLAYILAWGFVNCLWLALLRRPAIAAMLSLMLFAILVLLSRFKHDVLFMTVNFV